MNLANNGPEIKISACNTILSYSASCHGITTSGTFSAVGSFDTSLVFSGYGNYLIIFPAYKIPRFACAPGRADEPVFFHNIHNPRRAIIPDLELPLNG